MPATHRFDQEFAQVGALGEVPLATFGSRLAARLVDLLILYVPTYVVLSFVFETGALAIALICLLEMVVYDTLLTANTGATPGKRMARIRIVRHDTGAPAGWGKSFLRSVVIGVFTWLIMAIVALADERTHRGLHDRLAGTVVIAV
ncbi:MAG: RDD family protein [Kibdelosporangium sp.]